MLESESPSVRLWNYLVHMNWANYFCMQSLADFQQWTFLNEDKVEMKMTCIWKWGLRHISIEKNAKMWRENLLLTSYSYKIIMYILYHMFLLYLAVFISENGEKHLRLSVLICPGDSILCNKRAPTARYPVVRSAPDWPGTDQLVRFPAVSDWHLATPLRLKPNLR